MDETLKWLGIAFCISQSGLFSGLNLAVFSISRLRLEVAAQSEDPHARRVLALRRDANFTLATILWGNVAVNVLLTILADHLFAGISAFLFSTILITFLGEIIPQAYFARHALRFAVLFSPLLRFYQVLLWPVTRPTGWMLDRLVGPEGVPWYRERDLPAVLHHHARSGSTDLDAVEVTGAVNFLALDDLAVGEEGERLEPSSIVEVGWEGGHPVFPPFRRAPDDPFLRQLDRSGKKWAVLVDHAGEPHYVLNVHYFLRAALFGGDEFNPQAFCHRPLVVHDEREPLGRVLSRLTVQPESPSDDVIDKDIILVWADNQRIITGSDLLGRLLRGISKREPPATG